MAHEYDKKFIEGALDMVQQGDRSVAAIARDLGIHDWMLRLWCRREGVKRGQKVRQQAPSKKQPGAQEDPQEKLKRLERELQRLQKENDSLKMDREILKKAAAFFAKESE